MRALVLAILSFAAIFAIPLTAAAETPFAAGQIWTLTGDGYANTRVLIGKTEVWDNGKPIVHVTVLNAPVTDDANNVLGQTTIAHMPYTEDALRHSVGELVEAHAAPFPDFDSGYAMWKKAKGGVFTITVQQGISTVIKAALQAGQKPALAPST